MALEGYWRIVDESHFGVWAKQCPECGQHWVTVFCELIDWVNSDDLIHNYVIPVEESQVEAMRGLEELELDHGLSMLGLVAAHVCMKSGDGQATRVVWQDRQRLVLSHD